MERYKKYKDCGVEWIGEIPSGWETLYPKKLFFQRNERARYNDVQLTCSQKHGVISQKWFTELEDYRPVSVTKGEEILKHVSVGDFVISMRSFQGGLEYSEVEGKISSAYVMITPRSDSVYPAYYKYLFKSKRYIEALRSTSNLVRDGQAMRFSNFVQVTLPLPPKEEQRAISAFLELKISQIDSLIEETQNAIKLLEEYRKAVISEAVTKGLDPDVKMKTSGVEWIGEVPEEWSISKLKRVATICNGKDYKDHEGTEGDYPVYGSGGAFAYSTKCLFEEKSVLFGRKGTIDKPLYVEHPFWTVDTMYYSVIEDNCDAKYVYYIAVCFDYEKYTYGSALPSMTQKDLGSIKVPLPDYSTQVRISMYLDAETSKIDSLIENKKVFTMKLNEYKKSLISECVTGKVKVPGVDES